jgi:hypothetical protein
VVEAREKPAKANAFRKFSRIPGALSIRLRMCQNVAENSNPNGSDF